MSSFAQSELVLITEEQFSVVIEMAYATANNFTGAPVYSSQDCYLHPAAARQLRRAAQLLAPLKMQLKIWDAHRPKDAQVELFKIMPDPNYVSDPETGTCSHCRGVAIDVTIVDQHGRELNMGTEFDDFRPLAHHGNKQVSDEAQRNRLLLAGAMSIAGFDSLDTEWWHYQLRDVRSYPIIEKTPTTSDRQQPNSRLRKPSS